MSLSQINPTEWEYTIDVGGRNADIEITATQDGLQIGGEIIPWADLIKAKMEMLTPAESVYEYLVAPLIEIPKTIQDNQP